MSNRKHKTFDREHETPSRGRRMNDHDEDLNIETENTRDSPQINPISQTTELTNEVVNISPTTSAGFSNQMTETRTVDEPTSQQQQTSNNISGQRGEQIVEPVESGPENSEDLSSHFRINSIQLKLVPVSPEHDSQGIYARVDMVVNYPTVSFILVMDMRLSDFNSDRLSDDFLGEVEEVVWTFLDIIAILRRNHDESYSLPLQFGENNNTF